MFENLTDLQILALSAVFEAIDYEKVPDVKYKGLWQEIDHLDAEITDEVTKRQL